MAAFEVGFLCYSGLHWPPQTTGTACPTSSASETRSDSAPLEQKKKKGKMSLDPVKLFILTQSIFIEMTKKKKLEYLYSKETAYHN